MELLKSQLKVVYSPVWIIHTYICVIIYKTYIDMYIIYILPLNLYHTKVRRENKWGEIKINSVDFKTKKGPQGEDFF